MVFPGWGHSNIDLAWGIPNQRRFLQKTGSLGRLIYFDPRGMGSSDRIGGGQLPTLEGQMEDVLSVMDAVGSDRAAVLGSDSTGSMAILFAATYPERTAALIVCGSEPKGSGLDGLPRGATVRRVVVAPRRGGGGRLVGLPRPGPRRSPPSGPIRAPSWLSRLLIVAIAVGLPALFASLRPVVEVRPDGIDVRYRPFAHRFIAAADIAAAKPAPTVRRSSTADGASRDGRAGRSPAT